MRALKFITGHVIYNPAYTYKFQLKTTHLSRNNEVRLSKNVLLKKLLDVLL